MSSSEPDALLAQVRNLLESTMLVSIAFVALSMTRKEGDTPPLTEQFPVNLEIAVQATGEGAVYRLTAAVERPDISVSVSVLAIYESNQSSAFQAPDVARAFGEMVAIPALYPYARAKMQGLTTDAGVERPVVLGILDMTRRFLIRSAEEETDTVDDASASATDERSVSEPPPADLA
jgi:hypothetical protein